METRQALALIIAQCPDLARQATAALAAYQKGSPVAEARILAVVSDALRLNADDLREEDRALLSDLARVVAGGKPQRDLNLIVRATAAEKARVQDAAAAAGQTLSDYIRRRIGLG